MQEALTTAKLRKMYLDFFKEKGHAIIPSASLMPENDPTVLFTTAGMHPLVPYLLGEKHPQGTRLADVQKCIRTGDIDDVGDSTHLTFFEMLGNWSLGDYFKKEAISWSWEFLTDEKYLDIDPQKLFVTVFEGDDVVPKDEESIALWKGHFSAVGIDAQEGERIFALPKEDNWWGPAGETGPCGPDTEMFFDTGKPVCSPQCRPGCRCGKFVEIWNDVFMEYNRSADGAYFPMKHKNVDTGMGVERTVAVLNGYKTVYETDAFADIIVTLLRLVEKNNDMTFDPLWQERYDPLKVKSLRIIADHIRASVFILGDPRGVTPSNEGQGYVLRRLIRRAIRHGRVVHLEGSYLSDAAGAVIEQFQGIYPELGRNRDKIMSELVVERQKFESVLDRGMQRMASIMNEKRELSGKEIFELYTTYGFPLEMVKELAEESGMVLDETGFEEEFKKHQDISRSGAEAKFAGGLADHSEAVKRYHTATHLLHQALRDVLGNHVAQKGSNITQERLRFDFSHPDKMTAEQIQEVENIVNEKIKKDLAVHFHEMTVEEAKQYGAIGLFEERYGDKVKVYSVGDGEKAYSKEICGGPHVEHTAELFGVFKIIKEESVSAGIRRIKAVLE